MNTLKVYRALRTSDGGVCVEMKQIRITQCKAKAGHRRLPYRAEALRAAWAKGFVASAKDAIGLLPKQNSIANAVRYLVRGAA